MVWKFEAAPLELQALYSEGKRPHWVAFIPAAIYGPDLRETIEAQTGIQKFDTEGGVVYIGLADVSKFLELVGTVSESPNTTSGSRTANG